MSALRDVAALLADAVAPFEEALRDPARFRALVGRMGWRALTLPPGWDALGPAVGAVRSAVDRLGDDPGLLEVVEVVRAAETLLDAIDGLSGAPPGIDPAVFVADLRGALLDHLIITQLARARPGLYAGLAALGAIRAERPPAEDGRAPSVRRRFDLAALTRALSDPAGVPGRLFGWGGGALAADVLIEALFELFTRLRLQARLQPQETTRSALSGLVPGSSVIQVPLIEVFVGDNPLRLGFELGVLAATGGRLPGVGLRLWIPGLTDGALEIGRYTALRTRTGDEEGIDVSLLIRPDGVDLEQPFGGAALPEGGAGVDLTITLPPEVGTLGPAGGSHVTLGGASLGVTVASDAEGAEATFLARLDRLEVTLGLGSADGVVARLLGGRSLTVPITAALRWSTRSGPSLSLGPGDLATSGSVSLGPVRVENLQLTFSPADQRAELTAAAALAVQLGPVALRIDGAGLRAVLDAGAPGPLSFGDLDVGLRAPTGGGVQIDGGVVRGGGFVSRDPATGRYEGAIQLGVLGLDISGLARIDTARAPGDPVAVLAWVGARIPSVPLGLGFMLDRVGALVALHRRPDVERLRRGLSTGVIASFLFPENPVAAAATVLARLDENFPAAPGRHLLGPAAQIGWGSPRILRADLALLLELPAPVRVVLLGAVQIGLPTLDHRIVDLRLDVLGVVDFARRTLALDASLHDSKVAGYELTGDMALRMGWGDGAHFLLAIGGFHPRFRPPPGFPALSRLALTIGDNPRLRLEAYLALTSNTAQLGAHADLRFSVSGLSITGHLHFDALIDLFPLHIEAEITAGVAISYRGHNFASAKLQFVLTAPRPWHAKGKATIGILWWDVSVGFDVTWGNRTQPALSPPPDLAEVLRAALAARSAWAAELPAGEQPWIVIRDRDDGEPLRVHPLAALVVRQKALPLDHPITAYGQAPLATTLRFAIRAVRIAGSARSAAPVDDLFAPGQFTRLEQHARLSAPSFEAMHSGARVEGATTLGATARVTMDHDTEVTDPLAPPRLPRVTTLPAAVLAVFREHRARARPERPRPPRVLLSAPRFVLASTRDLSITAEAAAIAGGVTTYAGLREALREARGAAGREHFQIVPRAVTANPRARVVVVREDENLRNTDFVDTVTGRPMTRAEFVAAIRAGEYPDYQVRRMHGIDTPVSRPNASVDDNLG